jgi:resuscitation-promoting factor RpfA
MPYRVTAVLVAVGGAIGYGGAPAIAEASRHPSVLSNQLAGGCAVLGIAVYSWIVLLVLCSLGEHVGGRLGRLVRGCAHLVAPAAWRQSLRLACGLAAVAVPAVGLVATQASANMVSESQGGQANVSRPASPHHHDAIRLDGLPMPERPVAGGVQPGTVIVRPGDTLWDIAARHLGGTATTAEVAATWPQWYAANRSVIGNDPGLITPGTVLHAPHERRGTP